VSAVTAGRPSAAAAVAVTAARAGISNQ